MEIDLFFGSELKVNTGKELGKFEDLKSAINKAESTKGSEIIYKSEKDNKWHVDEIKQKAIFPESLNDLSSESKNSIKLDNKALLKEGIKNPIISFVDNDNIPKKDSFFESLANKMDEKAKNPQTSKKDLEGLIKKLSDPFEPCPKGLDVSIAKNPSMDSNLLKSLAKKGNALSDEAIKEIIKNPNTPKDVIYDFSSKNYSDEIKKFAKDNLK